MKKTSFILLILLAASYSYAQNKDSLWTTSIDKEVQWEYTAQDGTLVLGYYKTLPNATVSSDVFTYVLGIDPASGMIKWRYPSYTPTKVTLISGFDFVPNTPYIKLREMPLTIIDPSDGHVVVDVTNEGITNVEGHGYLLESGHVWVSGSYDGDRCISLFDLASGKKLWSNADFLKEHNKVASKLSKFSALTGAALPNKEPIKLLCPPINHGSAAMIIATSNGIFHADIASGKVDWEAELPDPNKGKMIKVEVGQNYTRLIPGPNDNFYVVKPAFITACSYATGKPAWNTLVKTSGPIAQIIYDENGLILCPGSSNTGGVVATGHIKMVNEKTGEELWGDGIKFNGGIKNYMYTDKGLAVAMESSVDGTNSINFIDVAAGKFILAKNVKVKGDLQYMELTPKGLLYKTDRAVNILGLETDESFLPLPVQSKNDRPILTVNTDDRFYFFSDDDGNVYEINKTEGTSRPLNKSRIDFKGGEKPTGIEVRKEGVSLYSQQNVALISFTGETKFSVYNPGVRTLSTVLKNLTNLQHAFDAVMAVSDAYRDGKQVNITFTQKSASRNQYDRIQQAFATTGSANYIVNLKQFGAIKNRLHASAKSNDNVYMMTKIDDRSVLAGVNKDTGAIVSKVMLAKRDESPLYEVDEVTGLLFYSPKGKNLLGWSNTANAITCYKTSGQ